MAEAFFLRYGSEGFDNVNIIQNYNTKLLINANNACDNNKDEDTNIGNINYKPSAKAYNSTVDYNSLSPSITKNNRSDNALCKYRSLVAENASLTKSNSVSSGSIDDIQSRYANMHLKVYNLGFGIALMMAYIFSKT